MATKKTSKFIRAYKSTLQQLADRYDLSIYYLYTLHLKGELHGFIEEQGKAEMEKYTKRFIVAHQRKGDSR